MSAETVGLAERVRAVLMDCLYRNDEAPAGTPPTSAVMVNGVVRNFAFHPERLAAHKEEVADFCRELPVQFHRSGGGGWSFLNMCMDKNGAQWGEQIDCEALTVLAIGTGQGGYPLPRDVWGSLPGGVPYVWAGL